MELVGSETTAPLFEAVVTETMSAWQRGEGTGELQTHWALRLYVLALPTVSLVEIGRAHV